LKPFLRKAWSFLRILRWAGHLILRPFLRKAWSFLRILRWAGHPILRPFLRKAWSFLGILRDRQKGSHLSALVKGNRQMGFQVDRAAK